MVSSSKGSARPVAWVYLDAGYTMRWRRGDPVAVVFEGRQKGRPRPVFSYSHEQQLVVGEDGRPLIGTTMADPSADSVSDNDGDEGRSEDWKYDFVPDYPSHP